LPRPVFTVHLVSSSDDRLQPISIARSAAPMTRGSLAWQPLRVAEPLPRLAPHFDALHQKVKRLFQRICVAGDTGLRQTPTNEAQCKVRQPTEEAAANRIQDYCRVLIDQQDDHSARRICGDSTRGCRIRPVKFAGIPVSWCWGMLRHHPQ